MIKCAKCTNVTFVVKSTTYTPAFTTTRKHTVELSTNAPKLTTVHTLYKVNLITRSTISTLIEVQKLYHAMIVVLCFKLPHIETTTRTAIIIELQMESFTSSCFYLAKVVYLVYDIYFVYCS